MNTVEGIAAILRTPMPGGEVMIGTPNPELFTAGMPITRDEERVGEVHSMWLDEDRVRWLGVLDAPEPGIRGIPVRDLVEARRLVGVPALTADTVGREGGVQVLDQWTATSMTLLDPRSAPWADLELHLR